MIFETVDSNYHSCFCQEARSSLTDQDKEGKRGMITGEIDDMRGEYEKEG